MGRREDIEARLRQLEAERAQLDRYGEDVYDDGDVIKFVKMLTVAKRDDDGRWSGAVRSRNFTFAALKCDNGLWYITGRNAAKGMTWDELVEFMYADTPAREITISIAENFLTRTELEAKLAAQAEAAALEAGEIHEKAPTEPHRCPSCDELTVYQSFSGGREYYCPGCDNHGMYEAGEAPPRARMLADGRVDELRAEMREEIARRKAEPPALPDTPDVDHV